MRKMAKNVGALALSAMLAVGATGCLGGGTVDNSVPSNVCKIKIVKAGYSVDWLYAVVEKFNETFAQEGYSAEITMADPSIGMLNEVKNPRKNDTDLYVEYNNVNALIKASRSILGANGGALLEDLTDVYNSKAIGLDKQEEGKTLIERFVPESVDYCKFHGDLSGYDGIYGMPYQGGSTGIMLNKKVLLEKGYTMDDILTTDGFLKVVDEMAPADPLDRTAFFPVAWASKNAPGYWDYLAQVLFAQYEGEEKYHNFWNFIPETGTTVSNGYTVYQDRGMYESLKVIEALTNLDYAVPGTASMDHIGMQARVLQGTSLFTVSGDWLYKEMELTNGQYLNDVIHIKTPVISALGVKLALCGTAHAEGTTCATCESKLKAIVKAVDNGTAVATIATDNGVAQEKVEEIQAARGYYKGDLPKAILGVPSYANAKDVAKTFIRFMYSDDMNDVYRAHTYVSLPIERTTPLSTEGMDEKEKAMYDIMNLPISKPVYAFESSPLRSRTGLTFFVQGGDQYKYQGLAYSHSQKGEQDLAKAVLDEGYRFLVADWSTHLQTAGLGD